MAGEATFSVGGLDAMAGDDEEELVPVNAAGDDTAAASVDDDDGDDDDGDDDAPEQLRATDLEKEIEEAEAGDAKTTRRREERQRKKERQAAAKESQERLVQTQARQLAEANARLYALENRAGRADLSRLDEAIQIAERNKGIALQRQQQALVDEDPDAAARAQEEWADFRDQQRQLTAHKAQVTAAPAARDGGGAPAANAAVVKNVQQFMDRTKGWYNVQGSDQDSLILNAIDHAVANEGFDPALPEYWQELESRAAKQLPDRFPKARAAAGDDDDPPPARARPDRSRKSPNAGGGGDDRGTSSASGDVSGIPREYINTVKDLGMWDDPKKRAEMIKRYRDSAAINA